MSFLQYKKNRTDISAITKKVEELEQGSKNKFKDSRFWSPTIDKSGNGSAVIRFLPPADGEDLPWVQYHDHNFENNGSYFIEMCPTTLGRECPVCKANTVLWKTEIKENQAVASKRKRKLHYISNIYVLKDAENPDAEGKVFLFRYGQKIYEKIKAQLKPKHPEDPSVFVFDLYDGADFRLEIKNVAGYRNYDDSNFRTQISPLLKGDEKKLEQIYNSLYPLQPFISEDKFKSFDALEAKFLEVCSGAKTKVQKKADELFGEDTPSASAPKTRTRKPKEEEEDSAPWENAIRKTSKAEKEEESEIISDDSDEGLDYYNSLADKD
jgi:hypothetical protein